MEGTMKSAIFYGIKDVKIEERPIPQITENDVLIKVLRAGICGSDTGAYLHGGDAYGIYPGKEFGHEFVGKIVEVGENVEGIQLDDIVFVDPTLAKKEGLVMADMVGAFSEYVNVENAKVGHNIYLLDKDIDLDLAAMIEPLSVGTQGAVCTEPKLGENIVVLGAGPIGLASAAGLIARGHKNVTVVDRNEFRLEKAKELGAHVINNTDVDLREELVKIYGGVPSIFGMDSPDVDMYIDAAGANALFEYCFNYARTSTRYIVIAGGAYTKPLALSGGLFMFYESVVRGSRGYTHETILEVIDHITNRKTCIENIITKKFKAKDFVEAIDVASKQDHDLKVLIDFE